MAGSFDDDGYLDWSDGRIITCLGKKKSGKSVMGKLLFRSYDIGDRIVIDVAGDDGPKPSRENQVYAIEGRVDELPAEWPEQLRPDRDAKMTLYYRPDPRSPTYLEDMDHVVGLGMSHGQTCILIHETHRIAPSNRVPPNMRWALDQNRHRHVTLILCNQRRAHMDLAVINNADLLYIFKMRVADDREEIAKAIGWDVPSFHREVIKLSGHEYLRYDANADDPAEGEEEERLVPFEPLPADVVASVQRWAGGQPTSREVSVG